MIGAMTRHEIQILRAVEMVQTAVAAKAGVSVRSVRRIEGEAAVSDSDTAALVRARSVGRLWTLSGASLAHSSVVLREPDPVIAAAASDPCRCRPHREVRCM